ncbi:unnamed protein product, partial [Phaeothamnion confervicola]
MGRENGDATSVKLTGGGWCGGGRGGSGRRQNGISCRGGDGGSGDGKHRGPNGQSAEKPAGPDNGDSWRRRRISADSDSSFAAAGVARAVGWHHSSRAGIAAAVTASAERPSSRKPAGAAGRGGASAAAAAAAAAAHWAQEEQERLCQLKLEQRADAMATARARKAAADVAAEREATARWEAEQRQKKAAVAMEAERRQREERMTLGLALMTAIRQKAEEAAARRLVVEKWFAAERRHRRQEKRKRSVESLLSACVEIGFGDAGERLQRPRYMTSVLKPQRSPSFSLMEPVAPRRLVPPPEPLPLAALVRQSLRVAAPRDDAAVRGLGVEPLASSRPRQFFKLLLASAGEAPDAGTCAWLEACLRGPMDGPAAAAAAVAGVAESSPTLQLSLQSDPVVCVRRFNAAVAGGSSCDGGGGGGCMLSAAASAEADLAVAGTDVMVFVPGWQMDAAGNADWSAAAAALRQLYQACGDARRPAVLVVVAPWTLPRGPSGGGCGTSGRRGGRLGEVTAESIWRALQLNTLLSPAKVMLLPDNAGTDVSAAAGSLLAIDLQRAAMKAAEATPGPEVYARSLPMLLKEVAVAALEAAGSHGNGAAPVACVRAANAALREAAAALFGHEQESVAQLAPEFFTGLEGIAAGGAGTSYDGILPAIAAAAEKLPRDWNSGSRLQRLRCAASLAELPEAVCAGGAEARPVIDGAEAWRVVDGLLAVLTKAGLAVKPSFCGWLRTAFFDPDGPRNVDGWTWSAVLGAIMERWVDHRVAENEVAYIALTPRAAAWGRAQAAMAEERAAERDVAAVRGELASCQLALQQGQWQRQRQWQQQREQQPLLLGGVDGGTAVLTASPMPARRVSLPNRSPTLSPVHRPLRGRRRKVLENSTAPSQAQPKRSRAGEVTAECGEAVELAEHLGAVVMMQDRDLRENAIWNGLSVPVLPFGAAAAHVVGGGVDTGVGDLGGGGGGDGGNRDGGDGGGGSGDRGDSGG